MTDEEIERIVQKIDGLKFEFGLFTDGVREFFAKNPALTETWPPIIHSVRSRLKDRSHLTEKIRRKHQDGRVITLENVFQEITDIGGVRVLHIHQEQLREIDQAIRRRIASGDWYLNEPPCAYTWDPESVEFMRGLNLLVSQKDSFYTSVHYVVRPRNDAPVSCEIQVRTLFEEIWGEVDHQVNYPVKTDKLTTKEQIRVLSKLVGAGSRLLDSLFRTHRE